GDLARPQREGRHAWDVSDAHVLRLLHGLRNADLLEQPDGGTVARRAEPRAQAHGFSRRVFVFRRPVALRCLDLIVQVIEYRRRRISGLQGGGVDEGLERRTRLTARLDRAVEAALREIASADHGPHLAG